MSKLEKMIELWEDKFLPLIDEYEDIEYILAPNFLLDDYLAEFIYFSDIKTFFYNVDLQYKRGFRKIIIVEMGYRHKMFDMWFYFLKD